MGSVRDMADKAAILYGVAGSGNVCPILFLLKEGNLSDKEIKLQVTVPPKDTNTKEFRTKNPIHTVPFLEDGSVKIWESRTILRYINNKYGLDRYPEPPEDPKDLPKYAKTVAIVETAFDMSSTTLVEITQKFAYPAKGYISAPSAAERDKVISDWKKNGRHWQAFSKLLKEAHPRGEEKFLGGDKLNIADFSVLGALLPVHYNSTANQQFFQSEHNDLKAYIDRCIAALNASKDILSEVQKFWT